MMDDTKITVFSNVLVEYLRDRLQISGTANQLLSIVVLNTIIWLNRNVDIQSAKQFAFSINRYNIVAAVIVVIIYLNGQFIKDIIKSKFYRKEDECSVATTVAESEDDEHIVVDISNVPKYIMAIYKYISLNPFMFNTNVDSKYIIYVEDNMVPLYNKKLYFNDFQHGVKGFITTKYSLKQENNQSVHDYLMHIHIDKDSKCFSDSTQRVDYINMILQYLENDAKYGSRVKLYYYKILHNRLIRTTYYDADIETWKNDVQLLQDTFFSEHKDMLFNVINHKISGTNIVEAQAWNNLLLHSKQGGLGKSSVINRVATMLKKNVISVDISQYVNRKNDLYSLFHGQKFKLPFGGNVEYDIANYIIVLEEFDHAIVKLARVDRLSKIKHELTTKNIERKQADIQNAANELLQEDEALPVQGGPDTMETTVASQIQSIYAPKVNKKFSNNMSSLNRELHEMLHGGNDESDKNVVYIGDLLELFQGPIHIVGRMIIATTNNFESIKEALPMLVRPGRLTPLKFDYLTWAIFEDLVRFYLDEMPIVEPFQITIPTSQIVELAIKYKNINPEASTFVDEIRVLSAKHTRI